MTERDAEIVRRYLAGETTPAIWRDYGIGPARVLQIAQAAGAYRPRIQAPPPRGPGGSRKPETTALRNEVVELWNAGDKSMTQIGQMRGVSRNAIARLLWEARKLGLYVLAVGRTGGGVHSSADSMRRSLGEPAYMDRMAQMRASRRKSMNESPRPDTSD